MGKTDYLKMELIRWLCNTDNKANKKVRQRLGKKARAKARQELIKYRKGMD